MSSYEDEEEKSRKRREIFAKMAAIQSRRKERVQLKPITEDNTSASRSWLTGTEQQKYDASQFDYVEPYKEAFESQVPANSKPDEGGDRVCELPKLRGRGRGRGGGIATHSGVLSSRLSNCKLEDVSTAKPPTMVEAAQKNYWFDNEYTSSICVGLLQGTYFKNYKINSDLPIYANRDYIINSINSYNVVIVEGATGCGKTTQVPMYILEDAVLGNPNPDRPSPIIYVTQPRKIAARSIARRVCEEHGWELGSIVGYQVGLDKNVSSQTVITFCTAGVLLQKLIQEGKLDTYTHIIIDEAHERDSDTDLLMMLIRTLMRKQSSFFRLVIMSATMDTSKLMKYYTCQIPFGHSGSSNPIICKLTSESSLQTNLKLLYYDKLRTAFKLEEPVPEFRLDEPMIFDACYLAAAKLILEVIPHLDTFSELTKSTLVFLPGLAEITKLHRILISKGLPEMIVVIPLHSCLSVNDQHKVFETVKPGYRKVILATNIAESSITVKDVGFIIDFCLTKILIKDPITRFPVLKLDWSTKDKSAQRAGRTGRCCEGKVFRLVPMSFFNEFPDFAQPELLTAPLELSVLRIKNFRMGELKSLFALVLDPPALNEIRTAVLELKQIGGLSSTYEGAISDLDGDLTELGRILSALPIDVHLSKLIVIGSLLDVLEDSIIIASSLSTNRTVVRYIYGNLYETFTNKFNWSKGSTSDLFTNLDIYKEFVKYKNVQRKSQKWLDDWCKSLLLDEKKLNEVSALVEEITSRLEQMNVKSIARPNMKKENRDDTEDRLMLKIAICAAFYPNYFLNNHFDVPLVKRALCNSDPTKTVIVGNLPTDQTPLYCDQILQQISNKISNNIDYICDHSRALLVINSEDNLINNFEPVGNQVVVQESKSIDLSVYLAIKFAESDRLIIREYQDSAAHDRMNYYLEAKEKIMKSLGTKPVPSWMKIVRGRKADNKRLIDVSDEEYFKIRKDFYLEVEFDQNQNTLDLDELHSLEALEEYSSDETSKSDKSDDQDLDDESIHEHTIFKKAYRKLRGPYSPVQMTFRSILKKCESFSVEVDYQSINSIVLDPEYEQKKCQLLVAASVGQGKSNRVLARDTTLMPRVPGLPTLMSLLFAQYYRLVFNNKTNCLAGAIFGLGWDENDRPVDKEYEVELDFDIHLTKLDIQLINECRRLISSLIRTIDLINNPGAPRAQQQRRLRDLILTILRRNRYSFAEAGNGGTYYTEEEIFVKDKHNVPKQQLEKLNVGETRIFLPVMETTKEFKEIDMYNAIRKNLDEMKKIEDYETKIPLEGIRCLLCGSGRTCFFQIRSKIVQHVDSSCHVENLKIFECYEERAKENAHLEADFSDNCV